jgi:hypothetical protein
VQKVIQDRPSPFGRSYGTDVATAVTDSNGRYVLTASNLDQVMQSSFTGLWLEARTADGLRAETTSTYSWQALQAERIPVEDLTLAQTAKVTGRVVNASGQPSPGVAVAISEIEEAPRQRSGLLRTDTRLTDPQGAFEFPDAYAGRNSVLMVAEPGREIHSVPVTAPSAGIVLEDRPSRAVLAGVVLDGETQKPIPGTTLAGVKAACSTWAK